jgi:hypothetical protein
MPVDQIEEALSRLDVGERALLDLSVHRGFDDERIAALLNVDVSEVGTLRRAALEKLFRLRAVRGEGARDAVKAELRAVSDSTWIDPPAPPERRRARTRIAASALLAVAAVAIAVALIATSGDSDSGRDDTAAAAAAKPAPQSPQPAQSQPASVALDPLSPGAAGQVTASLGESAGARRLTVKLRGLPAPNGAYELWLYDSLVHSRALGSITTGTGSIEARLPRDASSYSWLDLSRQPGADRVHHSGESLFRASLDQLIRGGSR